jgi:hypothetical protein
MYKISVSIIGRPSPSFPAAAAALLLGLLVRIVMHG